MSLTDKQLQALSQPLDPTRVSKTREGSSHLEAWDVRATLSRIFGHAEWSSDLLDVTMVYEENTQPDKDEPRWRCGYRATVRLSIHATAATYTESAFGGTIGTMPNSKRDDAHDTAIKTAESQAFKRAAMNLGTQFGLSLYDSGSTADVVGAALAVDVPAAIKWVSSHNEPALTRMWDALPDRINEGRLSTEDATKIEMAIEQRRDALEAEAAAQPATEVTA